MFERPASSRELRTWRQIFYAMLFSLCCLSSFGVDAAVKMRLIRHPALSPKGDQVAFSWRGDIWIASIQGGQARRITSHAAEDRHPIWSPDGRHLAFASKRAGHYDVFVVEASGGEPRQLTFHDADDIPIAWTPDGRSILFQSDRHNAFYGRYAIYQAPLAGGTPRLFLNAHAVGGALSPDGKAILFVDGDRRWWRARYDMPYRRQIWRYTFANRQFDRVSDGANADSPSFLDAQHAVYRQEIMGIMQLVSRNLSKGTQQTLSRFSQTGLRSIHTAPHTKTILLEYWDQLLRYDLEKKTLHPIEIHASGDHDQHATQHQLLNAKIDHYALAPDGKEIAIVIQGDLFVIRHNDPDPVARPIAQSIALEESPTWSPDGRYLAFTSDRDGKKAIFLASVGDDPQGKPRRLFDAHPAQIKLQRFTPPQSKLPEYQPRWSPDGRKIAFLRARGDIVLRDLFQHERVLVNNWNLHDLHWSPDGRWLLFERADHESNTDIFLVSTTDKHPPLNLSRHPEIDASPVWAPHGSLLAWIARGIDKRFLIRYAFLKQQDEQRDPIALKRAFLVWKKEYKLTKKKKEKAPPNGKKEKAENLQKALKKEKDAAPQKALKTKKKPYHRKYAQTYLKKPTTTQKQEQNPSSAKPSPLRPEDRIVRPVSSMFPKTQPATQAATQPKALLPLEYAPFSRPPLHIDKKELPFRLREIRGLPGESGASELVLSPTGEFFFFAVRDGEKGIYVVDWEGKRRKQLYQGDASALQLASDGALFFLGKGGTLHRLALKEDEQGYKAAPAKPLRFQAERLWKKIDKYQQLIKEAWSWLDHWFYDPQFHGIDWRATYERYRGLIDDAATREGFEDVILAMLGELRASHLGIFTPPVTPPITVADLGLTFDPAHQGQGLKIAAIRPKSPAALVSNPPQVGDILLAVEGKPLTPTQNLYALLRWRVKRPILLTLQDQKKKSRDLLLVGVSAKTARDQAYEAWVAKKRQLVDQWSKGRFAYAHIRAMGLTSLEAFQRDLLAHAYEKDALILDVRNNGGGWTTDMLLTMFRPHPHAFTVWRSSGGSGYPTFRRPFYYWGKPVVVLCNERSISNAEIFAHAFKNLKIGKVIGMPTYGGVISTRRVRLSDGSLFGVPFRGWWTLPHKENMENGPAVPDILVPTTPADALFQRDPQLQRAIQELQRK